MLLLPCVTPYWDDSATLGVPEGGGLVNGANKSAAVSKDVTKYCAWAEHATHATTQATTIRIDTQKHVD
jgi:hypothetical protein